MSDANGSTVERPTTFSGRRLSGYEQTIRRIGRQFFWQREPFISGIFKYLQMGANFAAACVGDRRAFFCRLCDLFQLSSRNIRHGCAPVGRHLRTLSPRSLFARRIQRRTARAYEREVGRFSRVQIAIQEAYRRVSRRRRVLRQILSDIDGNKSSFSFALAIVAIGGIVWLIIDTRNNRSRLRSLGGIVVLLLIAFMFSANPSRASLPMRIAQATKSARFRFSDKMATRWRLTSASKRICMHVQVYT